MQETIQRNSNKANVMYGTLDESSDETAGMKA